MQYIGFIEAAEKHNSAKIFKENLHTSVKILQICMDLQDSVQRSLQNPAEKILQICTDSQRSKTRETERIQLIFCSRLNLQTEPVEKLISKTVSTRLGCICSRNYQHLYFRCFSMVSVFTWLELLELSTCFCRLQS